MVFSPRRNLHTRSAARVPGRRPPRATTPALADQAMQAAKPARQAEPTKSTQPCAQPIERFGDDNPALTMPTTTRMVGKVEHASRRARMRRPLRVPRGLRVFHDLIVIPARVRTAALLFLPLTATACPAGWTPSPTSTTWGLRCYLVPPERSTSLFHCVELCEEHGGAPACIGSAEENAFVTAGLAATEGLWLGLYQNETGLGPAKGWGRCVAGDASSFINWGAGEPDDYDGYQYDCAWVDAGTGRWRALACDGGVRFDPLPWRMSELSCLCAHGSAASAAFANDRKVLEATTGYNQRLLRRRTALAYFAAAALAVLPTLLLLGRAGWRRLRATASPSQSVTGATLTTPSSAASSAAVKGKLRATRAHKTYQSLRSSSH